MFKWKILLFCILLRYSASDHTLQERRSSSQQYGYNQEPMIVEKSDTPVYVHLRNHKPPIVAEYLTETGHLQQRRQIPPNDRGPFNNQDEPIGREPPNYIGPDREPLIQRGPPDHRRPPIQREPPDYKGPPDHRGPPNRRGLPDRRGPPDHRGPPNHHEAPDYREPPDHRELFNNNRPPPQGAPLNNREVANKKNPFDNGQVQNSSERTDYIQQPQDSPEADQNNKIANAKKDQNGQILNRTTSNATKDSHNVSASNESINNYLPQILSTLIPKQGGVPLANNVASETSTTKRYSHIMFQVEAVTPES